MGRTPKVSKYTLLKYFRDLEFDATNYRLLARDEPFARMLSAGAIVPRNVSTALTRAVKSNYLERRGIRKGCVYRITPKGLQYLDDYEAGL
jgi:hypothetical protein